MARKTTKGVPKHASRVCPFGLSMEAISTTRCLSTMSMSMSAMVAAELTSRRGCRTSRLSREVMHVLQLLRGVCSPSRSQCSGCLLGEEDDEGCAEACISCLSIRIIYGGDLHHEVLKHDVDVDVCDGCRRTTSRRGCRTSRSYGRDCSRFTNGNAKALPHVPDLCPEPLQYVMMQRNSLAKRGRRRGVCRSTVSMSMSAMVAAEQLVDEVSISTLWTRKGNFIEWIKSGSSVSVALRRQHR